MGGPSIKTLNPASQPSLTGPGLGLLQNIFGQFGGQGAGAPGGGARGPSQGMSQGFPGLGGTGGPLQQMGRQTNPMVNAPSPLGQPPQGMGQQTAFGNLQGAFGSPLSPGISNTLQQFATGPNPGQGVVNAYAPIFQRNLGMAMDTGPRFSSGNELLRTQAMNDYNMFAQQALLGGQQQQIGAALGLGGLQQQAQLPMMQQLLQALFTGGGINAAPIYNVSPGFGQQLMGLLGQGIGAATGGMLGGGGGGGSLAMAAPDLGSQLPPWAGGTNYFGG